jgi:hypothetical protein
VIVLLMSTATAHAAPASLTRVWEHSFPDGYTTDGIALGDVHPAAGTELVVMGGGSGWAGTYDPMGAGRAAVLSTTSATSTAVLRDAFVGAPGHDFMGFPMIEDLAAGGLYEYVVSEFTPALPAPGGAVYARAGGAAHWTSTGYGYPGFWNMGPSAGNVRGDLTLNEVVIADYDGDIAVLNRASPLGATLNTFDTYNGLLPASAGGGPIGETLYGHAAIADVASTSGYEVVVFGGKTGRVLALNAPVSGGAMTLAWVSDPLPNGGYAFGSGPAVAQLDSGRPEMVVASATTGDVFAFDTGHGAGCKYKWTNTGAVFDYAWSSPVIGDVTGDGRKDIVVFSSDAVMRVLTVPATAPAPGTCVEGSVYMTHTVGNGGSAWFTPALGQLTGSSALDVVVATYDTLEVVNVAARTVAFSHFEAGATFYPSAVIQRMPTAPTGAAIYVSGWSNGKVYRFNTPAGSPSPAQDWPTFMGSNTRTGGR